ncbi:hypothetical protein [Micromonospora sp. NPDC005299]|uniref:hypothetical protein n=1 Tax=Micromonospora sp. NPDC005299 TaxID=3364231 RepID=UPI0036B65C58
MAARLSRAATSLIRLAPELRRLLPDDGEEPATPRTRRPHHLQGSPGPPLTR